MGIDQEDTSPLPPHPHPSYEFVRLLQHRIDGVVGPLVESKVEESGINRPSFHRSQMTFSHQPSKFNTIEYLKHDIDPSSSSCATIVCGLSTTSGHKETFRSRALLSVGNKCIFTVRRRFDSRPVCMCSMHLSSCG